MKNDHNRDPLVEDAFVEWLSREGSTRYHDHHPYHMLMHEGRLTKIQLQQWVLNRYYYQTRIPIKDAIIVSKSEDSNFRRMWLRRIQDQDGQQEGVGGLTAWLELARGVDLDVEEVKSLRSVLPGVRLACDEYVRLVYNSSLLEAVASSLTELFAPMLMTHRLQAWKLYYPWVSTEALGYFQMRIARASQDSKQALEYVVQRAVTYELQERCVQALIKKAEILWRLLDCMYVAYIEPGIEIEKIAHGQGLDRRHSQTSV
jgi:pyrroloquinoline-quinone synthase